MFSVVIPTKNEEVNLARLFESLKLQDLQPDEVIVADASTDKTREVALKYGARVVQGVSNGFIGRARNNAAKEVNSELIVFLDADVILPIGFLRRLVYRFMADNLDVASCILAGDRRRIKNYIYFGSWNAIKRFGSLTKRIIAESGVCMIVKRKSFVKAKGFSTTQKVGEEVDLVKKILKNGGKYKIIPVKLKTSDRRVAIPPHKLALQVIGLAGIGVLGVVGWRLLEKTRGRFEKMYGETGGKNVKPKK